MNNNTIIVIVVLLALFVLSRNPGILGGTNVSSGTNNSANGNNYTPAGNNTGGVAADIQKVGQTTADLIAAFAKIFDNNKPA